MPRSVSVAETRTDIPEAQLFPEEEAAISRAVERRRREFATARTCARMALRRWGLHGEPIPVGARGRPQWPAGIVGSITHCAGYRAAAVARSADFAAIGIDAEPDAELPERLLGEIARPEERKRLETLAQDDPTVSWDRLLFSIKECVFKAWFPLTERWLGFGDSSVRIDRRGMEFSVRLLLPGPRLGDHQLTAFDGHWLARDGLLLSAIVVPTSAKSSGGKAS